MKLIFIRHGDPDYVHDTVTARGVKEAQALNKRVAQWNVDRFYCSPLGRARDTAALALEGSGNDVTVEQFLREFYVQITDPLTGKNRIPWDLLPSYRTTVAELCDKDKWQDAPLYRTGDVAAQRELVVSGIDGILAEYGYKRDGELYRTDNGNDKTLVFFCHLGVQFVILSHLLGVSAPALWHGFFVAPTSVTTVATEEREAGTVAFRCKGVGDVSHLYAASITPSDSGFFDEVYRADN